MFIRKYWIPLLVFIVAIAGVGLYLLAIQPQPEPIVIIKPAEPLKESAEEKSTADESEVETEAPSDTSQGGHFHADGTFYAERHAPVVEPQQIADKVAPGGHWSDAYLPPIEELEVKYADDSDAMFIIDRVKILLKHERDGFGHNPTVDKAFAELMNFTNKKISLLGTEVSASRLDEMMMLTWPILDNPPSDIRLNRQEEGGE